MDRNEYGDRLVDTSPNPMLCVDRRGIVRYANGAAGRFIGVDPSAIIGWNAFEGIVCEPELRHELLRRIQTRPGFEVVHETQREQTDGSTLWIAWTCLAAPGHPSSGLILCHGRNITAQRNAEERYRVLFEESKDMIYACDADGILTEINPTGVELLGCESSNELVGRNIVDFYASPRDREYYNERILRNGFVKDLELVLRRNDGSEIFVLETSTAIRNADGRIVELRGIVKDISDRIHAEKLQMQMNIKLTDANRKLKLTQSRLVQQEKLASIGQLAAGVAHEINNPLGFVKSNFGSLKRYIDQMIEYLEHLELDVRRLAGDDGNDIIEAHRRRLQLDFILDDIESIFTESGQGFDRIISIVRGLRNFSRMDAEDRTAEYDLNSALEDALVMARNELKYVADVRQELGDIPPVRCRADEINQVLLNIIVNAAQAIKEADYGEKRTITIRTSSDSRWVICEIADDGPGMPEDVRMRVFDPFFTTKEIGRGTGLGLSISYDIVVNRHGGDLSVESELGMGSRFTIRLPISHDD